PGARTFAFGSAAVVLSTGATGAGTGDFGDSAVRESPASACMSASGTRVAFAPLVPDGGADMTLERSSPWLAALMKASGASIRHAKNVAAAAPRQATTIDNASPVRFGADA